MACLRSKVLVPTFVLLVFCILALKEFQAGTWFPRLESLHFERVRGGEQEIRSEIGCQPLGTEQRDCVLNLTLNAVTGSLFDEYSEFNAQTREGGNDWPGEVGHTMIGMKRGRNFVMTIESVIAQGLAGDIVELGVWRGGAMILAQAVLQVHCQTCNRRAILFDMFGVLDKTTGGYGKADSYLAVSKEQVQKNFVKYNLLNDNVRFIQGMFDLTVAPYAAVAPLRPIAVLRIDGNFYKSYMDPLQYFYERVPVGGYIIFDDIGSHRQVQEAWADFQKWNGVVVQIQKIDRHGAFFQKTQSFKPNWEKYWEKFPKK